MSTTDPSQAIRAQLVEATARAIVVDVESPDGDGQLAYRSPDPVWPDPPPTLDFVAIALAQFAAAAGRDLHVDGPVTTRQLDRLDEYVQIWSIWRPDLFRRISITADDEVDEPDPPAGSTAVMGFSGGVDASYALAAHSSGALGRLSRPVDLGVLVVGWDLRIGDDDAISRAYESARTSLEAYDARSALVSTNWKDDFCAAWFMSFNAGLTAILHTFAGQCGGAIHATDHNYRDELRMPPYGSNIAINHLLGRPGFPVVSTGGLHRRIERIGFLGDHPALLERLRVCYQEGAGGGNCGHCEKCVRTQLELRANGIAADGLFPSPMTAGDLEAATVTNATVLMHFEDILAGLDESDPWRPKVAAWVRRERLADAVRRNLPAARVPRLEVELARAQSDLAAIEASTSWRLTKPMRSGVDRLRALRQRD